jgi:acyl-coenzyme A synthetase/AMP-(fatty) acid ligase
MTVGDDGVARVVTGGELILSDADCRAMLDRPLPEPWRDAIITLRIARPANFVRTLIGLEGRVAGMLLLSPDLPDEATAGLMAQCGSTILLDGSEPLPEGDQPCEGVATTWLLTTSGTTGLPKIVEHGFASLSRSVKPAQPGKARPVWGLLYHPSRFAGLQVVLQALVSGAVLATTEPGLPLGQQLLQLAAAGCSHLSGTPSQWRKLLMTPESAQLDLQQVTLGGEIADGKLLKALSARFPAARVTHVYASTEVGVGFSVNDLLPGFPASFLGNPAIGVDMKVEDGMLWIRQPENARAAVAAHVAIDSTGYVCTGDKVTLESDRVMFAGRESSIVNVGGTKVQLEAVEGLILSLQSVSECQVTAKPNRILGAVLDLVVTPNDPSADHEALRIELKAWCKANLERAAQPAAIRIVDQLDVNAAGKLARSAS